VVAEVIGVGVVDRGALAGQSAEVGEPCNGLLSFAKVKYPRMPIYDA